MVDSGSLKQAPDPAAQRSDQFAITVSGLFATIVLSVMMGRSQSDTEILPLSGTDSVTFLVVWHLRYKAVFKSN